MKSSKKSSKWSFFLLGGVVVLLVAVLLVIKLTYDKGEGEILTPASVQEQVLNGFETSNQPYIGDQKAPVVIVEFADYKCPSCKHWTEDVFPQLKKAYLDTGKAVFYFVDLPFLAPDSTAAALAGESLYQQNVDYFWTYYKLMMEQQGNKNDTWATKEFIMDLVKQNIPGVDLKQFEQDLDSLKYIDNINADIKIADDSQVGGTPTIFVNGNPVEDDSFEGIKAVIEKQ
ncbi:DsbA family protein [Paenibacillus sp. FSL K6-2524]|uniref:DsbA family protein n=1 Tax=Paenibacillus sp. FSL K6-2524 TaxID=2954516 RepID=UPI0030FB9681